MKKEFDFLVLGATSAVAKSLVPILDGYCQKYKMTYALSARDVSKITFKSDAVKFKLDLSQDDIEAIVSKSRLVLNLIGPYYKYGLKVAKACLNSNTHYLDLTGEIFYAKTLYTQLQEEAFKKNIYISPFSGFDSLPTELGALLLLKQAKELNEKLVSMEHIISAKGGGINGGTFASALIIGEKMSSEELKNPYYLLGKKGNWRVPQEYHFSPFLQKWTIPFFMQSINSSVLFYHLDCKYKELITNNFTYRELMKLDSQVGSFVVNKLFDNVGLLFTNPMGRKLLKSIGPKSGDAPSSAQCENGFTSSQYFAKTVSGKILKAKLSISGDPANVATAKFMIAGANCLLDLKQGGGVGSPTYFCGLGIIDYLKRFDAKIET